jgi:HAD superfamily hydrolase (TIGR01450 family)
VTASPLRDGYDALLFDLDGTLYVGARAVPGAPEAVAATTSRALYVTNNASRSAAVVAEHLADLGFPATTDDVVTSAQTAARVLSEHVAPGSAVLVVGTDALVDEVARVGLRPVRSETENPSAVVQGHSTETAWPILAEAAFAIRRGAFWVATNTDASLPVDRGLAPGNGAMVAALRTATDREPVVAGKPYAPLMEDALRRSGSRNVLVIGDRVDTDIEGANEVGVDSLLVLTGVSTAKDLLRAPERRRPTFVAVDLSGLAAPAAGPDASWRAEFDGRDVVLCGSGDALAALGAVALVAWEHPEFGEVTANGDAAESAIRQWGEPSAAGPHAAVSLRAHAGEIG